MAEADARAGAGDAPDPTAPHPQGLAPVRCGGFFHDKRKHSTNIRAGNPVLTSLLLQTGNLTTLEDVEAEMRVTGHSTVQVRDE